MYSWEDMEFSICILDKELSNFEGIKLITRMLLLALPLTLIIYTFLDNGEIGL